MPRRDEISTRPELELGVYRHYKGGKYEVLMLACDEATHEWLVIYKALYDTKGMPEVWTRAYADFFKQISVDGVTRKRFEFIK